MKLVTPHIPGTPDTAEPPSELLDLIDSYQPQPPVVRWGLTITTNGRWAMYVSVPEGTDVPVESVEKSCDGFPVAYDIEPGEPIVPMTT